MDMFTKYANKPRAELRKKEYQLEDENQIKKLLERGAYGVLATVFGEQPFITPLLYVFIEEKEAIYFHGAKLGRLRANLHYNNRVAFNVTEHGRILAHQQASEFNIEYTSVTVFGKAKLLEGLSNKGWALQCLLDKYAPHLIPGKDYQDIQPDEIEMTAVYEIEIEEWTGKWQRGDQEYSDAYDYGELKP
jgi:nitroimidazol reductase NimA-like FMN-containing flavoprotein (pyridoxamine 5'-phosphate oxidase superfamily)